MGLKHVRDITASISESYHILSAPAAPAPSATKSRANVDVKKSKLLLEINFTVPEAIEVLKRYGVSDAGNMSSDELKKSYRKLVSKYHPDVGGSKEDFINIDSAYDTLNNRSRSTNQQPSSSNSSSQKQHPYHDEIQKEIEQYKLFKEEQEKRLFLLLTSINGVGPSTGLMILSSLTSTEIEQAILSGDVATIQAVKGIGTKTAQRIILELKDKVGKSGSGEITTPLGFLNGGNKIREEALQALVTLGFPKAVAEKNIALVLKKSGGTISLEELIKASLKTS